MEQPGRMARGRKLRKEILRRQPLLGVAGGRTQADVVMAVPSSQHEEGERQIPCARTNQTRRRRRHGRPTRDGTITSGRLSQSSSDGDRTTGETRSPHSEVARIAVNRVEIEYEVQLMFTALYNGMRVLEEPRKVNDNYPTLNGEEADALVNLFRLLAIVKEKSFPEWKRTIQERCKDMHRSSWTVVALIQKRIGQNRLASETKATPWSSPTSTNSQTNVKEQGTQLFAFQTAKYSEEEQRSMIRHCKQKFEYTPTLREPTAMEWEIMLAILEGELLIRHLPNSYGECVMGHPLPLPEHHRSSGGRRVGRQVSGLDASLQRPSVDRTNRGSHLASSEIPKRRQIGRNYGDAERSQNCGVQ
ncbi:hypothetical protein FI667_g12725, partial [Globisporangium splendens]